MNDTPDTNSADQPAAAPAPAPSGKSGNTSINVQRPLIIAILYLLNIMLGFSVFVGLILAYVWRSEANTQEWERSHYTYLIRTFWISFAACFVTFLAWFASFFGMVMQTEQGGEPHPAIFIMFFGWIFVWFILAAWFCVRCIMSLVKSGNQQPMPNPKTWLF